jgi:hypothetical protein
VDTSDNKIPFGLKNGILVSVSEVDSGLACGCVCPSCYKKLQAKKGKKVAHYFSHDPAEDTKECKSAFETAISGGIHRRVCPRRHSLADHPLTCHYSECSFAQARYLTQRRAPFISTLEFRQTR